MADEEKKEKVKKSKSSHKLKEKSLERSDKEKEKEKSHRRERRSTVAAGHENATAAFPAAVANIATEILTLLRPELQTLFEAQNAEIKALKEQVAALSSQLANSPPASPIPDLRKENDDLRNKLHELADEIASLKKHTTTSAEEATSPRATDVLKDTSSPRLSSLTASRPRVANRKPSGYPAASNSDETHADAPVASASAASVASVVAASAISSGVSVAAAALSPSTTPAAAAPANAPLSDDEIDRRSLSEDEMVAIRELFSKYDINNDGVIDRYEFELILEDLRRSDYMSTKISDGIFKKFVSANWDTLDSDKNGTVDLQEFVNFVASSKAAGNMFTKPLNLKLKKESQRNLNARGIIGKK